MERHLVTGLMTLLKGVEKTGSLRKVAGPNGNGLQQGLETHPDAWNKGLVFLLLDRKVGGRTGGGSRITPPGQGS